MPALPQHQSDSSSSTSSSPGIRLSRPRGFFADALAVGEVAGVVVGDPCPDRSHLLFDGYAGEKLVHVFHLVREGEGRGPGTRCPPASRSPYSFNCAPHPAALMTTTSTSAFSNASMFLRASDSATVRSPLCTWSAPQQVWISGDDHVAAVFVQYAGRRGVYMGEHLVHHASRNQAHPVGRLPSGRHERPQLSFQGTVRHDGNHGFHVAQPGREQPGQSQDPYEFLKPQGLVDAQRQEGDGKSEARRQQRFEHQFPEQPVEQGPLPLLDDLGPGGFHETAVVDAGGTGRFAGPAVQAPAHVRLEVVRQFDPSIRVSPHEVDPAAGGNPFPRRVRNRSDRPEGTVRSARNPETCRIRVPVCSARSCDGASDLAGKGVSCGLARSSLV